MKHKMGIVAYVTRGSPKLDAFVRRLEALLQQYKDAGDGKLDLRVIEAKDPKKAEEAEREGLTPLVLESSDRGHEAGNAQGYMGLVFRYGDEKDVIPLLSPDQANGLEFLISSKLCDLRDKVDEVKHRVGVLAAHDEMKLSEANLVAAKLGHPSMQQIITRNFPSYELVDVDLKNGDQAIDGSLEGLIITQPGKDLTDEELRRIDEFVMKGKSLAVFASAVNLKEHDATMTGTLNLHNLDKLLEGYGIEMHKDVVLDFGRSYRVPIITQAGLASVRFPQLLQVDDDARFTGAHQLLDTSAPPFFRMREVVLPFASSLTLHKEKQPDATELSVMARSSPHSIAETGDSIPLGVQSWHPNGSWRQVDVAARVEGRLRSAFPEGRSIDAIKRVPEGKTARVFVLASSQFTANPFARAGNGTPSPQFAGMTIGDDKTLLAIAGPYADLQHGASPLLAAILVTKNVLDWMTRDPGFSVLARRAPCHR